VKYVFNGKNKVNTNILEPQTLNFENPECCAPSFYNRKLHLRTELRNGQPQDTKQPIESDVSFWPFGED
jgi:hypothetical protein